jgi:pyruvate ferredoxin oxidoreductase delta subunit
MKKDKIVDKYKYVYGPTAPVFDSVATGSWRIVRPVVDRSQCTGCGQCETFCPCGVIEIHDREQDGKVVEIDWTYCKGCGICANVCPKKCIQMAAEEEKK